MARWPRFLTGPRGGPHALLESLDGDLRSCELLSPWEIPLDHKLALHLLDPVRGDGTAYVPVGWDSIPDAATQALTELICVRRPRDMVVAPGGIRRVKRTDVYCPTEVLAAGDHGVALWVDDLPFDRVTGVLAYRDIRMIEHRSGTESAHLTVTGPTHRFTLHYRRAARPCRGPQVEDLLLRIRLRVAGLSHDIAQYGGDRRGSGATPAVAVPGASRVVLALNAPGWSNWTPRKGARRTVVLTDHELVLCTSAVHPALDGGQDILAVPRRHLRELRKAGARLCVDAEATQIIPLGASFARRVAKGVSQVLDGQESLPRSVATHSERVVSASVTARPIDSPDKPVASYTEARCDHR